MFKVGSAVYTRRCLLAALIAISVLPLSHPLTASADDKWPSQPIRIVAPYPAGGSTDRIARVFSEYLSAKLSNPVIVENRPGGGSAVGSTLVARSKPDGYTLLLSGLATHIIAPITNKGNTPDPFKLTNIGFFGGTPTCLVVSKSSDIRNLAQLRSATRDFTYGTVGIGSAGHLAGAQLGVDTGVKMVHVPYTGLASLQDVMSGRLDFAAVAWTSVRGLVDSGDLRPVAISSSKRIPGYPDMPTFTEQGVDVDLNAWLSLSAPEGLDPDIVRRLNEVVVAFSSDPAVEKQLDHDILERKTFSVAQFDQFLRQQADEWAPRVQRAIGGAKN